MQPWLKDPEHSLTEFFVISFISVAHWVPLCEEATCICTFKAVDQSKLDIIYMMHVTRSNKSTQTSQTSTKAAQSPNAVSTP